MMQRAIRGLPGRAVAEWAVEPSATHALTPPAASHGSPSGLRHAHRRGRQLGYHAAHVAAGSGHGRVTAAFILTLAVLGFAGAFLAGLVGVGGAIVMIPLLLYVPPLVGMAALDIKTVAGITMVQVTAAAFAGLVGHLEGFDRRLFVALAPAMVVASFGGAFLSKFVDPIVLEAVFAGIATLAAVMTLALRKRAAPDGGGVAF